MKTTVVRQHTRRVGKKTGVVAPKMALDESRPFFLEPLYDPPKRRKALFCWLGLCRTRLTGKIAPLGRILALELQCPKCGRKAWRAV